MVNSTEPIAGKITVVGLGPGRPGLMTREAWQRMREAEHLYLRTAIHPTVAELRAASLAFSSYDDFYEKATDFASLYQSIAADLIKKAKQGESFVYAVPGSPLVAEQTVVLLRKMADAERIALEILPGMSFVEVFYTALGIDPIQGLAIIDAADVARLPQAQGLGRIITQVYSRQVASNLKLSMMDFMKDEQEIIYVRHLGMEDEELRRIPLYELDRQPDIDHLTSLYVPPVRNIKKWGQSKFLCASP